MDPNTDIPVEPFSDDHGFGRGTPLDRYYIEAFLDERRHLIEGSVLEVEDATYAARFGGRSVSETIVVDIDPSNPAASLVVDLCEPSSLPCDRFDCIILTQTLHLLRRPDLCLENCKQALRSSGTLLVTVPAMSRVSPTYPDSDYWRFTPAGIAELFSRHWSGNYAVTAGGNLRSCIGFLLGEVVEDLADDLLRRQDPRFPLNVAVEARNR